MSRIETVIAVDAHRGAMAPPGPVGRGRGVMSTPVPAQPGPGVMEPDPNRPPLHWAQQWIAFLWLIALVAALIVEIAVAAHHHA